MKLIALAQKFLSKNKSNIRFYFNYRWQPKFPSIQFFINQFDNMKNEISFIQIGTNDGFTHDPYNKFIIRKNKWEGILIEPNPIVFTKMKSNYLNFRKDKKIHFENIAIAEIEDNMTFYVIKSTQNIEYSRIASLKIDELQKLAEKDKTLFIENIVVQTNTLENIIKKYNLNNLDMLLIDAEGYDDVILENIDLEIARPKMIIFEHTSIKKDNYNSLLNRFQSSDYGIFTEKTDTLLYDFKYFNINTHNV